MRRPTTRSRASRSGARPRGCGSHPNPGRTDTFRRLSRVEYQNAIRDILDARRRRLGAPAQGRCEPRVRQRERTASCRRRCSSAIWRRRRRSAGPRSAVPLPSPASHVVVLPADLTQEDHLDGLAVRHARRRGRSHTRSRCTAATRSRSGCRATATRTSRDSPSRSRWSSRSTASASQMFGVKPNRNQSGDLLRGRGRRQGPESCAFA